MFSSAQPEKKPKAQTNTNPSSLNVEARKVSEEKGLITPAEKPKEKKESTASEKVERFNSLPNSYSEAKGINSELEQKKQQ